MDEDLLVVVVITGPVGAGKTTTSWALYDVLVDRQIPTALIDMDFLRTAFPQVTPFNSRLGMDNLAAIAPNYRKIGVRCFVVSDVVETPEQPLDYERAIPGAVVTVVRLNVPMETIAQRLRVRETPESLDWYLARAPVLQEIFESRGIGDVVIEVGERSPKEIALEIASRLELMQRG
ncbi:MAG: adenylyl-sulfate kinase [Thermomicrobiales bacterium]